MKKMTLRYILTAFFLAVTTAAMAADISDLDRVHVLMSKTKVVSILGAPHHTGTLRMNLTADLYTLTGLPEGETGAMVGAGCIYDKDQVLKGQAFMFSGKVAKHSADHMTAMGFALVEKGENTFRLLGKDDDSGHPIVVYIFEEAGVTTMMVFEKGFYDSRG